MAEYELPVWARKPLLGLYVRMFGCNMTEAVVEDLRSYPSLMHLFVRPLRREVRAISQECDLVSATLPLRTACNFNVAKLPPLDGEKRFYSVHYSFNVLSKAGSYRNISKSSACV